MALRPLLGICKAQVGPTCRGAATMHEVGMGPGQEQGRLHLPTLLSLGCIPLLQSASTLGYYEE